MTLRDKDIRLSYADTRVGRLHYAEGGQGVPLLGLHQTPRSHDEYAELMPLLARSCRMVAMDMYGFGESAKPASPHTIEDYATGVIALADALGIEKFAVMGHHTGAVVAIEVAASLPERVGAVILSSPAFTDAEYRCRHVDGPAGVDAADRAGDGSHLTTWWSQRQPFYPAGRPDLLDRFVRDALAPGVDPLEGHLACARYRMEDSIGLVRAPVLLLGADQDPFAFPDIPRVAAALKAAHSVELQVIEGGSIPLLEEHAEVVGPAVLDFLRRVHR